MEVSDMQSDTSELSSESFGDISRIVPEADDEKSKESIMGRRLDLSTSALEVSLVASTSGIENSYYNATDCLDLSDILGLVGKKWTIFRISPLWNLQFNSIYLNELSMELKKYLEKNIPSKSKQQKNSSLHITVEIEVIEVQQECKALKFQVFNLKTNSQLYTGCLFKSPNYNEQYNKTKLSEMPILMVHGNVSYVKTINCWLSEHFDCVVRPFEFSLLQLLWIIGISISDAGNSYNESVIYHYLYNYELEKGKMDVQCQIESEFIRLFLNKLLSNQSNSESNTFHYNELLNLHSEIEEYLKSTSGINFSKLKLLAFEAPKVVFIKVTGNIKVESSSLMELILKYIIEIQTET